MYTIQLEKHSKVFKDLCELYFPDTRDLSILDFTYGSGALFKDIDKPCKCCGVKHVKITKCDADPMWKHKDEIITSLQSKFYHQIFSREKKTWKRRVEKAAGNTTTDPMPSYEEMRLLATAKAMKKSEQIVDLTVLERDLFKDSYADLGRYHIVLADFPYLINRDAFDYAVAVDESGALVPMQFQGMNSWGQQGLTKFVTNQTVEIFNERVKMLSDKASDVLLPEGLLVVKVMNVRDKGHLVNHDVTFINTLAGSGKYTVEDRGVYIRMGPNTWIPKNHLHGLHGNWIIFKLKEVKK